MVNGQIKVRVCAVKQVAPMIREFTLKAVSGALYPFSPGSHVMVEMQGPQKIYRNTYSLVSDSRDTSEYRIAVRLENDSRGGSVFMHQHVQASDELLISPPANLFSPEWRAKKHVLIAGGIGITPFMSYLPELQRRKAVFELHYLFRGKQTGAYRDALAEALGSQFFSYDSDADQHGNIEAILANCSLGTHVYVCGPVKLIHAVQSAADKMGWPKSVVHIEEFVTPKPGRPFSVQIKSTNQIIAVAETESLLEALERSGVNVPSLCRGGACGSCFTSVLEGEIEHRDDFLTEDEKASHTCIMPCVSRSHSDRLVLDI